MTRPGGQHADLIARLRGPYDSEDQLAKRCLVAAAALEAAEAEAVRLRDERDEAVANASLFLDRLIIGDKPMGEGDTVATFFKMKDRAEAAEAEVARLREAALHFHAYVKLWSDDLAANLKPTPESLAEAGSIARKALAPKP